MARLGYYVDTKDWKKLHEGIQRFAQRAYPHAVRNALNGCAFELRKGWQLEIRQTFTNRNAFTQRSIRVEKATGSVVRGMKSVTGSVAPYMGDQEGGATIRGRGKHKAIPGPAAAGLKPGAKRTKLVRPQFRLGAIQVNHPSLAKYGRRRQNAVVLAITIRKGERFALLNRAKGKGRGLFEVKGLKRKAKTKLLYNVSKGSVRVKPEPTMRRAVLRSKHAFDRILHDSLLTQLKRNKVMGF
jgi:hypothetical protein